MEFERMAGLLISTAPFLRSTVVTALFQSFQTRFGEYHEIYLRKSMARRYRIRQNPYGSFFGGLVGIVFVCIGIFVVIPNVGAFGVFWTAVAAGITIASFYNAFSDKGIASEIIEEEIEPAPRPPSAMPAVTRPSVESRLQTLENLHSKGLITFEEYDRRRAEILREI